MMDDISIGMLECVKMIEQRVQECQRLKVESGQGELTDTELVAVYETALMAVKKVAQMDDDELATHGIVH